MPKLTPQEIDEFFTERGHLARIATIAEDGAPSVVPVWFLCEHGRIHITPRQRSAYYANLKRDPRLAITIDESAGLYRKVLIEGRADFLYEPGQDDLWRDVYRRIALRYIDEEATENYISETIDQPRALIGIELAKSKVTTWRMPKLGEPYTGIWATRYYVEGSKMRKFAETIVASRGDKPRSG